MVTIKFYVSKRILYIRIHVAIILKKDLFKIVVVRKTLRRFKEDTLFVCVTNTLKTKFLNDTWYFVLRTSNAISDDFDNK